MGWTVECKGTRAAVTVFRPRDDSGLYKAYLRGREGRFLLGTLAPEDGTLVLRRDLPIDRLRRCGAWPVIGADIVLEFTFPVRPPPPKGWRWSDNAKGFTDPVLQESSQLSGAVLLGDWPFGTKLAYPYSPQKPFPLPPLFCLSKLERLGGKEYIIYYFREDGTPCLPNRKVP
ncbi:MAG: hypothetical protein RR226_02825 [Oscillospiraceae bacterium]